jgi:LysM repeat protein
MWTNSRRRSATNVSVWSLAFVGFSGLFCWYAGWLPFSFESPDTGTLAENTAELGLPDGDESFPDSFGMDGNQLDFNEADPVAYNSQTEPPVQEGATDDSLLFPLGTPQSRRDEPEARDPPFRPPSSFAAKRADAPDVLFPKRQKTVSNSSPVVYADTVAGASPNSIVQVGGDTPANASLPAEVARKLEEIDELLRSDQQLVAHRELSTLYWVKPQWRPYIKDHIEQTAQSIYFSDLRHYMQPYVVQSGDRLQSIAKQHKVPWEYLVRLNHIDPRRIRPGQKLKVIKGPFSARLDLSEFELTIHAHGYFVRRFSIGIGRDDKTPIGRFKVLNKLVNPTYFGPDGNVIDANDPQNPLGERWIDIGDGFGIHGTIDPRSIGRAESRGCIRLLNSDVEIVYDLLGVGSEIIIRN